MDDALDVAKRAVAYATAAGANEAEATYVVADRFSAEARGAELAKLERSVGRTLTLRVFREGGRATLTTTDLTPAGLEAFAREAVDAARYVEPDPNAGLPVAAAGAAAPGLDLFADDVPAKPPEAKIAAALELERTIRAADARIVNSSGSRVADAATTVALANSHGFAGTYATTQAQYGSSPIARDGAEKRTSSYGTAARSYAALQSVDAVAREAARRTVAMIGARKPVTARCPVIFERDVASSVLGEIFSALSAANVAAGNSFFAGRIGERLGSSLATLVDDGRLPGGLGSSPFDAEGVPTRRTVVFENGTLRTFLYDTYYGRRLGAASTGNAASGGIGPNNFYLAPGARNLDELIATTPRGVLVLETIGFATESVTGTYSRGARGFAIEGGELAYPIDEFTIAGNLVEMLAALDGVASDLIFDQAIVSPSFRIAEMTVSGS